MNQNLQSILSLLQQNNNVPAVDKESIAGYVKAINKELETTTILLEKSIEELEGRRKKAEAQNYELEIEAALERVRAVAMDMNRAEDMLDVCKMICRQLELLHVKEIRNVQTAIFYKERGTYMNYEYYARHDKTFVTDTTYGDDERHAAFAEQMQKGNGESFELTIPDVQEWIAYQKRANVFIDDFLYSAPSLSYYWYSLGAVALGISTYKPLKEEDKVLFKRFLKVFELAYRRYLDIERAEAQARQAKIEAALERVRSRTMAMQRPGELAGTATVLFKQLIDLGIAPNRLYIGIIHSDNGNIEFWITSEDGNKVSAMFTGNAFKNASVAKMFEGWQRQQKRLVIDMQGEELAGYFKYLDEELHVPFKHGHTQKRRLQYISYFSQGFIGMASPVEQPATTIELLERFACVFNLTFTRFNDLKIAEAHALQAEQDIIAIKQAKKRAEEALQELQLTQKQLVQSEKMASLGELTAGIAHEIQNPLNFVNNFSEVSNELIEELLGEKAKPQSERDEQFENELLADIKQNLEKINHHGKRAEAIVKGMLQHSRKSEGKKEPTDINALCDEYLRLSYHGLRAKDKSFNAGFKTEFDESIGKINVVPQDIGRVVLNILTNAFYAVNEKSKTSPHSLKDGEEYQPVVAVSTKFIKPPLGSLGVLITIADNGNGIPQNIIDKIFQPFFTTKPAGQGTGLGLSLAYDIIKAHDGEIKVETREGEGTGFKIVLPA